MDKHFTDKDELRLVGTLAFHSIEAKGLPRLDGSYRVKIIVPQAFPVALPRVYALEESIPKSYHTYQDDSLCLGAPLYLHSIVSRTPTLLGFVEGCVVPYLYRYQYIQVFRNTPWGELGHGAPGLLLYYKHLLGSSDPGACVEFLRLGALRKRVANSIACPCGSGLRLGRCHHRQLNKARKECGRAAMRTAQVELVQQLAIERRHNVG